MAVANGMRSVAHARPTLCDMLAKELDTEIPAKPRRSISRAVSSVARRRPGVAIRLRAGKVAGMAVLHAMASGTEAKQASAGASTNSLAALQGGEGGAQREALGG